MQFLQDEELEPLRRQILPLEVGAESIGGLTVQERLGLRDTFGDR